MAPVSPALPAPQPPKRGLNGDKLPAEHVGEGLWLLLLLLLLHRPLLADTQAGTQGRQPQY